mmetsp:Transcript_30974/g.71950  ORF Transcript_30974/g.71950 Transcript_30974/m.71950 type:complete len:209 (-) Transcript_30974:182-808(-)
MTGVVFARLRDDGVATDEMRSSCFLMRSLYRFALAAEDPLFESGVIIALSRFGATVKTHTLLELLAAALPCMASQAVRATIRWIDDTAALAILPKGSCVAEEAVAALSVAASQRVDLAGLRVQTHEAWSAELHSSSVALSANVHATTAALAAVTNEHSGPSTGRPAKRARCDDRVSHVETSKQPAGATGASGSSEGLPRRSKRLAAQL